MSENDETVNWKVSGSHYPDGCGKAVLVESLTIGDGAAPAVLIRIGSDDEGSVTVNITTGGFSASTTEENTQGLIDLFETLASVLSQDSSRVDI